MKARPHYNELIEYMAQNWVDGSLAGLKDADRMQVLTMMMQNGLSSKRLLGQSAKHIVQNKTDNLETVAQTLYVMAISRYNPKNDEKNVDVEFLDKVKDLFVNEPAKIKLGVATKTLWSMYAFGHKDKSLIKSLSPSLIENHQIMDRKDVVNCLKAYAYFDYLDMPVRDSLVKTTIHSSQNYDFKSLANICESLAQLEYENKTLLQIVKRIILTYESRDALDSLIDTGDAEGLQNIHMESQDVNYLRPV